MKKFFLPRNIEKGKGKSSHSSAYEQSQREEKIGTYASQEKTKPAFTNTIRNEVASRESSTSKPDSTTFYALKQDDNRSNSDKNTDPSKLQKIRDKANIISRAQEQKTLAAQLSAPAVDRNKQKLPAVNQSEEFFKAALYASYTPVVDSSKKVIFTKNDYKYYQHCKKQIKEAINQPDVPEKLISRLKKIPFFNNLYKMSIGVWEGYTLEYHTLMVLNQFKRYQAKNWASPLLTKDQFCLMLAVHDSGKPLAVQESNDSSKQHEYNGRIVSNLVKWLEIPEREGNIIVSLTSTDYLGQFLKKVGSHELPEAEKEVEAIKAAKKISDEAAKIGVGVEEYFELVTSYYRADAGAYTEDAGGKKALDFLFEEKTAHGCTRAFSKPIQSRYNILATAVKYEDFKLKHCDSKMDTIIDDLHTSYSENQRHFMIRSYMDEIGNLHAKSSAIHEEIQKAFVVVRGKDLYEKIQMTPIKDMSKAYHGCHQVLTNEDNDTCTRVLGFERPCYTNLKKMISDDIRDVKVLRTMSLFAKRGETEIFQVGSPGYYAAVATPDGISKWHLLPYVAPDSMIAQVKVKRSPEGALDDSMDISYCVKPQKYMIDLETFAKEALQCGQRFYDYPPLERVAAAYNMYLKAKEGANLGMIVLGRLGPPVKNQASNEEFPYTDASMILNLLGTNEDLEKDAGSLLAGGNTRNWSPLANDAWILGGVHARIEGDRKTEFHFASPLRSTNIWNYKDNRMTLMARELIQLVESGYEVIRPNPKLEPVAICVDEEKARSASLLKYKNAVERLWDMHDLLAFFHSLPKGDYEMSMR